MNINNEVTPFCFGDNLVRVIRDEAGDPWWVAKDVCDVLTLNDVSRAVERLEDDEKLIRVLLVSGQKRETWTVNEPGLYTLIIRSNKPEAKAFKRWVTHEVLPSIRKTGSYQMGGDDTNFMDDAGVKRSGNMYFPMAKLVESADKYLEGKAALKALNYFTGMPVDDLLAELDEKQFSSGLGLNDIGHKSMVRDAIGEWLSEKCDVGGDYSERASVLYQAFCHWAKGNMSGARPVTMRSFGAVMGRNFERRKSGVVYYLGVRLAATGHEAL
ncbi:BRO family protein [uncultured Desulfobacter sp.]|uniref:BRO-N domain-containing protein n=1 Tax=uncultured Desulfobacter sp. TaxID=240139 RepID=UPI0029F554BD|nr:BRO family protein [uncultured Desulfobacter sp.]